VADLIRVGALGLSHDHVWDNLRSLSQSGLGRLVAAADPRSELQDKVRAFGCERVFDSPHQLLEKEDLDAVYVYSDNCESTELAIEAARRGLHVMVEKPMAVDLAGAIRMRDTAGGAGVQLMVNWPIAWWPQLQQALRLAGEGRIGRVFQVNYRAAHAGPREVGCSDAFAEWLLDQARNGGGALTDYCSYGAALVCHLLGLPSRVTAVSGRLERTDTPAEDNAVLIMENEGAISTATASWTQVGHLTSYLPMIYGTEGTLVVQGDELRLASREYPDGIQIEATEADPELRSSATLFLHHVRRGEPITGLCGPEVGLAAQEVLEAGLRAARTRQSIQLPLVSNSR